MTDPQKTIVIVLALVIGWTILVEVPRRTWSLHRNEDRHKAQTCEPQRAFTGGAAWLWTICYGRAVWPFVRVEIWDWGIRVRSTSVLMRWYVPSLMLPWDQISKVEYSGTGIVIRIDDIKHGMLRIWPHKDSFAKILEELGLTDVITKPASTPTPPPQW